MEESEYVKYLLKTLEAENPCSMWECPIHTARIYMPLPEWEDENFCRTCKDFINLYSITDYPCCPCGELGEEEAIKRAWLTLEEKGYLE